MTALLCANYPAVDPERIPYMPWPIVSGLLARLSMIEFRRHAHTAMLSHIMAAKAIAFAEKNVQSSLTYAQQLIHAKDLAEVMRLHTEYVQAQMRALAEQASEMGQTVTRAAMDAAKPKS